MKLLYGDPLSVVDGHSVVHPRATATGRVAMMSVPRTLGSGLLAVALAACRGGAGSDPSVRRDSSGVAIVTAPAADGALDWSWSAQLRLGGQDAGPESFYAVTRRLTAVDSAGRLFVLDPSAARVVRFNAGGDAEWAAGSVGGGPGEMLRPWLVAAMRDGGALVHDARKDAFVPFDASGQPLDPIPAPLRPEGVQAFAGGYLLKSRHYHRDENGPITGHSFRLSLARPSDTVTIAETSMGRTFRAQFGSCGGPTINNVGPIIYAPELHWHANPVGLAVNAGSAYVVDVYLPPGRLARSVRRPGLGRPATRDDALAWAAANPVRILRDQAECRISPDEMVDKMGFADSVPAIADVAIAPSGELWVRRWAPEAPGGPIDLFDGTGAYVGTLPREFPFPLHFLPSGDPLFSERDENDVERLVVARLVR